MRRAARCRQQRATPRIETSDNAKSLLKDGQIADRRPEPPEVLEARTAPGTRSSAHPRCRDRPTRLSSRDGSCSLPQQVPNLAKQRQRLVLRVLFATSAIFAGAACPAHLGIEVVPQ